MSVKFPRILFFIKGSNPSLEEQLAAEQLAPCRVGFRNVIFMDDNTALEDCDGVIGEHTPKAYKKKYASAKEAIEKYQANRLKAYEAKTEQAKNAKVSVAEDKQKQADKSVDAAQAALNVAADKKVIKDAEAKKAKASLALAKENANKKVTGKQSTTTKEANAAGAGWKNNA